jgi:hypothetical protein
MILQKNICLKILQNYTYTWNDGTLKIIFNLW